MKGIVGVHIAGDLIICAVLLLASAVAAHAQAPVGDIRRMYEDDKRVESTERAVISSRGELSYAREGYTLRLEDLLEVDPGLLLGLYIDDYGSRGRYSFASDLGAVDDAITDTLARQGIYEIRLDPRRLTGLEFLLRKGQLFFQQLSGGVSVRAGGTLALVDGTETLVVGTDTTAGLLYLRDGRVRFPDFPDIQVGDDELWRLRSGQRPQQLVLGASGLDPWRRLTEYHREHLAPKPFWQKPRFFIPAAAVVIGGSILLFAGGSDDDPDTAGGTVTIRLPD